MNISKYMNTILKTTLSIGITNFSNKVVIGNVFHFDYLNENLVAIINNGITVNVNENTIYNLVLGCVAFDGEKVGTIREYKDFPNLISISCLNDTGGLSILLIDKTQQCIANLSYEETIKLGADPKVSSNWMTTMVLGHLNKAELELKDIFLTPTYLVELINLINSGEISSKQSKEIFYKMLEEEKEPKKLVKDMGMKQIGDESTLRPMIVAIVEQHLELIEEYRKGRNVFDFFVGQVMKQTRGQANPTLTAQIIKEEIDKR